MADCLFLIMDKKISIFMIGLVAVIVIFLFFGRESAYEEPVIVHNDTFQRTVVSIWADEYLQDEDFIAQNVSLVSYTYYESDFFDCDFALDYIFEDYYRRNISCIMPAYWKDYSYNYDNGTVLMGFRIFDSANDADNFINNYLDGLSEWIVDDANISGYIVEARTIIAPRQIGPMIDRIEFFVIELPDSERNNILISIVRSDTTIYYAIERTSRDISPRSYTFAFTEHRHEHILRELLD